MREYNIMTILDLMTQSSTKIKKIAACTALALMCSTGIDANAQNSNRDDFDLPIRKIESIENRMMGGVDITLDYRFNPANIALLDNPFSLRLFGVEATTTKAREIYDTTRDILNLTKLLDSNSKNKLESDQEYYLDILNTLKNYTDVDIRGRARFDLLQFSIRKNDIGILMFGLYGEGESIIKTDVNQIDNITEILGSIQDGELSQQDLLAIYQNNPQAQEIINKLIIQNISTPPQNNPQLDARRILLELANPNLPELDDMANEIYNSPTGIDLRKELNLVRIIARTDIGGYLGIGKRFELFSKVIEEGKIVDGKKLSGKTWTAYISAGIKARGYYRLAIPKFHIKIPKFIQIEQIFKIPLLRTVQGRGYGIDIYCSLALNDPILNTQISLELKDVINKTFYETGQRTKEDMQINLGLSVQPLIYFDYPNIRLGIDVENLERSNPTLQLGLAWRLGSKDYNLTPKVGYIINELNYFDEREQIFTAGAEINLSAFKLNVIYEDNLDTHTQMFGAGLRVEF